MAGDNQFSPLGLAPGANVLSAASWQALTARQNGFAAGIAKSVELNTAWRQGTVMAAMIGQFIADRDLDARDDGDLLTLQANFEAALGLFTGGNVGDVERIHTGQDTGAVNSIVADVSPSISAYGFLSFYFIRIRNTNTGSVIANFDNRGALPVVRMDGTPLRARDILKDSIVPIGFDGSVFRLVSLGQAEAVKVPKANEILYVSPVGNDGNDGSSNTAAGAFRQIAPAIAYGLQRFSAAGTSLTIQCADSGATPYEPVNNVPPTVGLLRLRGNPSNPGACVIAGSGIEGQALVLFTAGAASMDGFTVRNTDTVAYSVATTGANVNLFNTVFQVTSDGSNYSHAYANGFGSLNFFNDCSMSGNMGSYISASGGLISISRPVAMLGSPTVGAVLSSNKLGLINVRQQGSITASGTVTGQKYSVNNYSVIDLFGKGANSIPGTIAGTTNNGLLLP